MDKIKELHQAALEGFERAYAPYSNFHVGAAILSESGEIYSGCNVENVSYPCGSCAEQNAIGAMIAGGEKKIKAILILAEGKDLIKPCGACLQRIQEFSDENITIFLADKKGVKQTLSLAELLPHGFAEKDLKHD